MLNNLGSADRIIRIVTALVVIALILANTLSGTAAVILGILAAILLLTGFVGFCPLYYILSLSTKEKTNKV
jgi:hypothetical protein